MRTSGDLMGTTLNIQSNPVNTDTEGAMESVCVNGVSVLSRMNLDKM